MQNSALLHSSKHIMSFVIPVKNVLRILQDNLSNGCLLIVCTAVSNTSVKADGTRSDEEQGHQDETDDMDELHKMVTSDLKLYDIFAGQS